MMTEQQVVELMESSSSEEAWNDNADKVIKACDGEYPSFWFGAIVLSGLADRVLKGEGQLTVTGFDPPSDFDA